MAHLAWETLFTSLGKSSKEFILWPPLGPFYFVQGLKKKNNKESKKSEVSTAIPNFVSTDSDLPTYNSVAFQL